jgi:hypothetical protein
VRDGGQQPAALDEVAAHALLHAVERRDHAPDLARPLGRQRRGVRFLADRVRRAREAVERARGHAHQERGEREADQEKQEQERRERLQARERLVRHVDVEYRHGAVFQAHLHHDREWFGQQKVEVARHPKFEPVRRARLRVDIDAHRPARADLALHRLGELGLVGIVLGEAGFHRDRLVGKRDAQVRAAHLFHDLAALGGRQAVENARGPRDARGDLQRGKAVDRAAAVEKIDRHAAELREHQPCGEHEQRAPEERRRQDAHQPRRSTAAAST